MLSERSENASPADRSAARRARAAGAEKSAGLRAHGGWLLFLGGTLLVLILIQSCASPSEPPAPPSGGEHFVLSFERFSSDVSPVLTSRGCNAEGDCHGGGIRGTFELSPAGQPDLAFDFHQASLQVDPHRPASSLLVRKPLELSAGGLPHSRKVFADTSDAGCAAILAWVRQGSFQ